MNHYGSSRPGAAPRVRARTSSRRAELSTPRTESGTTLQRPVRRPLREAARLARGALSLPALWVVPRDAPRGQGETVLVVPGFLTGDRTTIALRSFLRQRGYRAVGWLMGINRGDVDALVPRVAARVRALSDAVEGPIKLVGWSLGGLLCREAARLDPSRVDRIVTLGTPIVGGPKYTLAAEHYRRRGVDLDALERRAAAINAVPLPVKITAIYSRVDGVVAWRACLDDNPQNDVEHIEVRTGHAELGFSPRVLRHVAAALSEGSR